MLTEQFGARLKYWRTSRGLTQKQLAKAAGVSYIQIMRYEQGKRYPTLYTVEALLNALNVDIATFFGEDIC